MPNWCINDVTIAGPSDKISKIYYDAIEKNGLLEADCPFLLLKKWHGFFHRS